MKYIDERFKERRPEETVEIIAELLKKAGIEVYEEWVESGIENVYSLSLYAKGGVPSANGKGVTKALARASAYGEFIERLQGGLFFYKYQSIADDESYNLQAFAPDVKYMTVDELAESGEWMDSIIEAYGYDFLTRKSFAEKCKIYDHSKGDKILTVPFYSLFEKKYVYLPMGFIDQIYATNGCCVGNTKEEAWVHALSEIMERHASINRLLSGKAAPKFSDETLSKYPTVKKILDSIRAKGDFDIDIFDYSEGNGFPVVSTRLINKKTQGYLVNVAADPVFEIALQRTLTEMFQGRNIDSITSRHGGKILSKVSDFSPVSNVVNQLETGNGIHTADFFANELTDNGQASEFADNSGKTNKQLLEYILGLYKNMGKQVYVRNFSYLGFPCYRFVVPGYSEALAVKLTEKIPEYGLAKEACKVMKAPAKASDSDIAILTAHNKIIGNYLGRYSLFGRISGIPLTGGANYVLAVVTRAYAAYRLNNYKEAVKQLEELIKSSYISQDEIGFFTIVNKYLSFKLQGIDEEKIRVILRKFFEKKYYDRLYALLDSGLSPYDEYLLDCVNFENCSDCRYKDCCSYHTAKEYNLAVGMSYRTFVDGQNEKEFTF